MDMVMRAVLFSGMVIMVLFLAVVLRITQVIMVVLSTGMV